jgi:hypothetical protein
MKQKFACLFIFSVLFFSASYSQITKGFWMFGGSGSIESGSTTVLNTTYKSTSIRLDPRGGYFFADKLAAGLTLAYDFQKSNVGSSFSEPSQSLGIGPFVRYYFLPIEKRVNILAEVNGAYSRVFDADAGALQYGFLGGIALFLNSTVALELLPGYRAYKTCGDIKSNKNSFVMNIGLQIHLERDRDN